MTYAAGGSSKYLAPLLMERFVAEKLLLHFISLK